jgi:hypothetical protein
MNFAPVSAYFCASKLIFGQRRNASAIELAGNARATLRWVRHDENITIVHRNVHSFRRNTKIFQDKTVELFDRLTGYLALNTARRNAAFNNLLRGEIEY